MTKDLWFRWLLLFSLSVNIAGACTAVYIHYFIGPRPFVLHFVEKRIVMDDPRLNLSSAQKKEFRRLEDQFLDRIEADFPKFHQKRMDMINALAAPTLEQGNVLETAGSVRKMQSQFHEEWVRYLVNLRLLLDPGQQKIFGEVLRERLEFPLKAPGGSDPEIGLSK